MSMPIPTVQDTVSIAVTVATLCLHTLLPRKCRALDCCNACHVRLAASLEIFAMCLGIHPVSGLVDVCESQTWRQPPLHLLIRETVYSVAASQLQTMCDTIRWNRVPFLAMSPQTSDHCSFLSPARSVQVLAGQKLNHQSERLQTS
jgi:hypothetical protein